MDEFVSSILISLVTAAVVWIITWFWKRSLKVSNIIVIILTTIIAIYMYYKFYLPPTLMQSYMKRASPIKFEKTYTVSIPENECFLYKLVASEYELDWGYGAESYTVFEVQTHDMFDLSLELYSSNGKRIRAATKYIKKSNAVYIIRHVMVPNVMYFIHVCTDNKGGSFFLKSWLAEARE